VWGKKIVVLCNVIILNEISVLLYFIVQKWMRDVRGSLLEIGRVAIVHKGSALAGRRIPNASGTKAKVDGL
jgi:hypothetical protein